MISGVVMKIEKNKKAIVPLSKRERKRYVLFEVLNAEVAEKDFYFGFWIELLSFFGSRGLAEINPKIVLFRGNKAIVKCKRGKETDLIAGTAFIDKIRNKKVIINPLLTSGTINALKKSAHLESEKDAGAEKEKPKQVTKEK